VCNVDTRGPRTVFPCRHGTVCLNALELSLKNMEGGMSTLPDDHIVELAVIVATVAQQSFDLLCIVIIVGCGILLWKCLVKPRFSFQMIH
jgi:hypothetical protein